MTTTETPSPHRIARRVKRVWHELDYAQRRLLEIRTGVPFTESGRRERVAVESEGERDQRTQADELESLFSLPARN